MKHPFEAAGREGPEAYSSYVEGIECPSTTLEAFFSIRLDV